MDSVQNQSYSNVVHVILDNNSSDETADIISRYMNGSVPIVYYRNDETLDQLENWEKAYGLLPAEATYARFLCDDDTIEPTSVAKMVAIGEEFPNVGVIGCLHEREGSVEEFYWPKEVSVIEGREAMRMALLLQGVLMPTHMIWRRNICDRVQPLFSGDMDVSWDADTVFRLLAYCDFGFVHECLAFTRIHENSITSTHFPGKTRAWTRGGLDLLMRHGQTAFGNDHRQQLLAFRRFYVRRILQWWREDRGRENLRPHFDALAKAGFALNSRLIGDAVIDWIYVKLGKRRAWRGYPGWQ
jgi:glycosyltransferase involved in cell wall biosynthesis